MRITIPKQGDFAAFAMIVDINGFTNMVRAAEDILLADFIRDVLQGSIRAIETEGGEVAAFMGDAILAVLPDADSTYAACARIAKDLNEQCDYISRHQNRSVDVWPYSKGGPSLKISLEHGILNVSKISSRLLGTQKLLIGDAINYAARISTAGYGNRCHVGPNAALELEEYGISGPFTIKGKGVEGDYGYYKLDMSDIWREGLLEDGEETYW